MDLVIADLIACHMVAEGLKRKWDDMQTLKSNIFLLNGHYIKTQTLQMKARSVVNNDEITKQ